MDAQLKAKWVEALRSGEYTQERQYIGNPRAKRLCCLGVGAMVARPDSEPASTRDAIDVLFGRGGYCGGEFSDQVQKLINMNDIQEASFAQIANWIEANL